MAIRQHAELCQKIDDVNKGLRAIQLAPITVIYLVSVSAFFYLGRINEWIWVMMTLYPLTPLYEPLSSSCLMQRRIFCEN